MPGKDEREQTVNCLDRSIADKLAKIQRELGDSDDLIVKKFRCLQAWHAVAIYIDGLVDTQLLHNSILKSLLLKQEFGELDPLTDDDRLEYLQQYILIAAHSGTFCTYKELYDRLLTGHAVLILEDEGEGLWIDVAGLKERSVGEPQSHAVVRGPMEGFAENIRTNTALIRRRIRDPSLWIESKQIGKVTHTSVAVMYIKGIADEGVLEELRSRLDRIDIDGILESGYIEEEIQDKVRTPFPTIYNSERPDTIAAGLLEGRIAIVVDGTPFVLLIPALFVQFFQSPDDYYQRADISTLIRLLRYLAFFIALLAPAMYIAISTFHLEMLPTNLIISIAAQREGVPFPAFIEALLMELTYEILREAGVRIPRTIGQAVSIVGTLVIGQAAVAAGVVSAAMVIVVSITAISSYVIPENGLSRAVRMLRFCIMFLAASFGLLGIWLGLMAVLLHLTTLRSFGVPYMSPFGPFVAADVKDSIFRLPWNRMKTRPVYNSTTDRLNNRNGTRQKVSVSRRRKS
ncbi:spore germination protein [Paenibacillus sp. R14(2021)]|uniref:spore germination protein n=1 Tax=Paenibacillus sp. R14(2021) TaxID=2859228 RepID=UPI001C61289A|nr:spore germination protein [Paenibacillus sp. R14(2021)]